MSVFGELNALLEKIPVWRELVTLPKRVAAIEARLNMAGALAADDRPVCSYCRQGRLNLEDEKPHRVMGDLGVMEQTWKCERSECGRTRTTQRES